MERGCSPAPIRGAKLKPKSKIRETRINQEQTQAQLADKAGIALVSVSHAETGKLKNTMMIQGLADALGWSFEEITEAIKETREDKERLHQEAREEWERSQSERQEKAAQRALDSSPKRYGGRIFLYYYTFPLEVRVKDVLRSVADKLEKEPEGTGVYQLTLTGDSGEIQVRCFLQEGVIKEHG